MKTLMIALLASLLLVGCGQTPGLAPVSKTAVMAAKKNTSTKTAVVTVPADVMVHVENHVKQLREKYPSPHQTVSIAVNLVVSNDKFKRNRHEATLPASEILRTPGAQTFAIGMLNGGVTPGQYEYYLVVKATVFTQGKSRLAAEELEDFYVSDFGKNYPVTLQ